MGAILKRNLTVRLGGFRTHLAGLDEPLSETLRQRFSRFLDEAPFSGVADLVISVRPAPASRFIDRSLGVDPQRMESEVRGDRVLLRSHAFAGSISLAGREGEVLLCDSRREPPHRSVERFLRVALAWRLLGRGALMVQAVGILRKGHAWLLLHPEGIDPATVLRVADGAVVIGSDYLILEKREAGLTTHVLPMRRDSGASRERTADQKRPPSRNQSSHPGPEEEVIPVAGILRCVPGGPSASGREDRPIEDLDERTATAALLACAPYVSSNPKGAFRAIDTIRRLTAGMRPRMMVTERVSSLWEALAASRAA